MTFRLTVAHILAVLRAAAWVFPVAVFGFLVWKNTAPLGSTTAHQGVGDVSIMSQFKPDGSVIFPEKNLKTGEVYRRMVQDTATSAIVIPPSGFSDMDVELEFKTNDQPILEIGVRPENIGGYSTKTVYNRLLDELDFNMWTEVPTGTDVRFFQRKDAKQFTSWQQFMDTYVASDGALSLYRVDFFKPSKEAVNLYPMQVREYAPGLVGRHVLRVYVSEGEQAFISLVGNQSTSSASKILVRAGNKVLATQDVQKKDGVWGARVEFTGTGSMIDVELAVDPNFTTELLTTNVPIIRVQSPVRIQAEKKPVELYASGVTASGGVKNPPQIRVDGKRILEQDWTKGRELACSRCVITLDGGSAEFTSDGELAFDMKSLDFDLSKVGVGGIGMNSYTDLKNINYIAARYAPITLERDAKGWTRARVRFDIQKMYNANRKLQVALFAPQMNQLGSEVYLRSFDFTFTSKSLLQAFFDKLK